MAAMIGLVEQVILENQFRVLELSYYVDGECNLPGLTVNFDQDAAPTFGFSTQRCVRMPM